MTGVLIVATKDISRAWPAVADVQADVFVLGGALLQVLFLKAVAAVAGGPPGFDVKPVTRRTEPFDRDPVVILMKWAVGKRIETNNRLAFPRDVQLEGNILAGLEH